MTRLAVRVQHHETRDHLLERLNLAFAEFTDYEVVTDHGDPARPDTWRAHRACLHAIPAAATHLLVVQDDVLPRPGFHDGVAAAIDAYPEALLLAFVPGFGRQLRSFTMAHRARAAYVPFLVSAYVPTVAVVYPREVALDLLAWVEKNPRRARGADDNILATYCRDRKIIPRATVPCLVDHDDTVPSVGRSMRRGRHRRAALL